MGLLDFLTGNKTDKIKDFQSRKAIIIDVRTKAEFSQGAIPGSKNIPLQMLHGKIEDIKKMNSGMRSASAASVLNKHGIEAVNGGGWSSLQKKL